MKALSISLSTAFLALAGCTANRTRPEPVASVDEAALDKSVEPCADFYQFACGGWMQKTPIPADESRWVRSFSEIAKRNEQRLRSLLEEAAASPKAGDEDARKLGDLYATCMDEAKAETASQEKLQQELAAIDKIENTSDLARLVAAWQQGGTPALFNFRSGQDFKDATQVIGVADSGGLGLPDRDMYEEPRFEKVRGVYLGHLQKLLELAGEPEADAQAHAKSIFDLEAALAKSTLPRAARRKPENIYHRLERKGLVGLAPHFAWDDYFSARGVAGVQAINVTEPAFFEKLDAQLNGGVPLPVLKEYLRARFIETASPMMGKAFVDESFRFRSQALSGAKEDQPRWKKCVQFTDRAMGQALGRLFVQGSFAGESKQVAQEMIKDVERAFEENLARVAWMDDATREASKGKLHKVFNKIGYADKWRDYQKLEAGRASYLQNAINAWSFEARRQLAKIGKPVDRGDWGMSPPTVNAYYSSGLNEMVFPAGILQSPFFALTQDDATNYGAAAFVMGHELTHGFDDSGRKFDGDGNLREWWTPAVVKAYEERAECVARQYDAYTVLGDLHLNGHLTLGENIADVGGLKLAYRAFQLHRNGRPEGPKVAGFTDDQRFFLSAAQVWCQNTADQEAQTRVKTDPHSPGRYRVNGPLVDNPDFAKAFQCAPESKMAPKERCEVW